MSTAGPIGHPLPGETGKGFRDGTHRIRAPRETVARVQPLLPQMGITRVANITGLDHIGIPVVMVCRPNSRSTSISLGKGIDLDAAMASGIMESIETYHAERISLPLRSASHAELRAEVRCADVNGLPSITDTQFTPEHELFWIEGTDLLSQERVWLPFEMVHTNYTLPSLPGSGCFMASSNGLASGNHLLEATSHAIAEVIERDAMSLWELKTDEQRAEVRLNLETVDDPACRRALQRYSDSGMAVGVWDVTSDIGVPCFTCWILGSTQHYSTFSFPFAGWGCHPEKSVALHRALSEAAQGRLTLIAGARDDLTWQDYEYDFSQGAFAACEELLRRDRGERDYRLIPNSAGDSIEADVENQLVRLRRAGIGEVIVVDLTKYGVFDVPVVRVVIPGLEGPCDHPRYTFGARADRLREGGGCV